MVRISNRSTTLVIIFVYLSVAILMFCETRWKLAHHLWGKLRPDVIQPQNKSDYKSNKLWKLVTRYNTLFLLFIVQTCSTIPVYCTGSLQDTKETIHSSFPLFLSVSYARWSSSRRHVCRYITIQVLSICNIYLFLSYTQWMRWYSKNNTSSDASYDTLS
jgi:hypothetical protein